MATKPQQADVQCVECGQYIEPFRSFICKSCKRRPLCREHRDPNMRGMCVKCANTLRRNRLNDLKSGLRSMKGFLRFLEFLFLVSAVMFAGQRLMPEIMPAYISENIVFRYSYVPGILSALGFVVVYFIYMGQKNSVKELESEINGAQKFVPRMR